MSERVTTEQARRIAVQSQGSIQTQRAWLTDNAESDAAFLFNVQDLAADLLDARAEIERLSEMILQARCIYCGLILTTGVPSNEDESDSLKRTHIEVCEKHPLALARAEVASLRAKLAAVCGAAEDAIGYAHQHDSEGRITFIDRSQPIAQYSDDGPDAWPARLHAAIAAAREGEK